MQTFLLLKQHWDFPVFGSLEICDGDSINHQVLADKPLYPIQHIQTVNLQFPMESHTSGRKHWMEIVSVSSMAFIIFCEQVLHPVP